MRKLVDEIDAEEVQEETGEDIICESPIYSLIFIISIRNKLAGSLLVGLLAFIEIMGLGP